MDTNIKFEGLFEKNLRKRAEKFMANNGSVATLTKGLLITAAIGGTLVVGSVAPNLFRVLGVSKKWKSQRLHRKNYYKLRRSIYELKRRKLLKETAINGGCQWSLTEKGKTLVSSILGRGQVLPLPRVWDKKWRLIFFDIPTKKRAARDALRRELQNIGCYQFQKSVWIYPFPCASIILEIAACFEIEEYIEVCTVEDFSNTRVLHFFQSLLEKHQ